MAQKIQEKRTTQYLSTFAVALASMTASFSYSWTTPVLPKFHNNETSLHLSDAEISWVVSSSAVGMVFGCLIARYSTDKFGRRATLLGTALPYTIGTIFVVAATKAWMLYVARFCWGLGSAIISPCVMIYIAEIASKEIRGRLSIIKHFMFTFGALLVISVGSVASYQTLSYVLVALCICYFGACWCIPESPYYLIKEGKVDRAQKALKMLNNFKDEKILEDKLTEMRVHVRHEMKNSATIKELFTGKQYRKAILIAVGLRLTQVLTGAIALQQYLGRILQETNSELSVSTGIIIYGSIRFTTSLVASFVIDKVGRRPLLICSYLCATVSLASLGTLFFFHEVLHQTPSNFGYATLGILMLFTMLNNLGFDTVNFVMIAEIFPLNIKATAITALNIFISFVTFFMLLGYQRIKDLTGMYGVFWFFACFALSGAIFSYLVVPETKGKSLREIQAKLQGTLYDEAQDKLRREMEQEADLQENENINKKNHAEDLKV